MEIKTLLQEAEKNNINAFALTDINNTSGCLNFVRLAGKYNIRPILGVDFRNGVDQQFIAIAADNRGFELINRRLSHYLQEEIPIPDTAPFEEDEPVWIIYPFGKYHASKSQLRNNEFLGVSPRELTKLQFSPWRFHQKKLLMLQTVTFRHQKDFNTHRLLRSIDNNTLLSKLSKSEEGDKEHVMYPLEKLVDMYRDYPALIYNTRRIIEESSIYFEFGDQYPHKNKKTFTGTEEEDYQLVKKLCYENLPKRYGNPGELIHNRLKKELDMIRQKGFLSYFLINWDLIRYARHKGYFYVGRGSGANSIIAYLLMITDVDPVELDLYFERFINLYRKNPPDFDIDFSWRDRDDITHYIFDKYGNEHTSLLATYSTFQYRSVIRELGKVFGLPPNEISKLEAEPDANMDHIGQLIFRYGKRIHDLPSHLSVHAGGVLICEKPIYSYTATEVPPKGFPITQFDMLVAEDVGLYKFDILSQRGLGKIKDSLEVIKSNRPDAPEIDIHDMERFKTDEKVKAMLRSGQAIGCFYVESPAMRMLLKKLMVDDYLGLVAASSIIRPGVARSGMMREYILRFRFPEQRKRAHPIMLDIMPDTFGVMVYQEDVIKVAHYFAGLGLSEADNLRRGMSGKFRSRAEFAQVKEKFFKNCEKKGYDKKLIEEIWFQVESFAGYAFSKGHSASYAVESYQSLFLKAHYPLEYMVATINNGGGFYSSEFYFHEARMWGATIHAPCINKSEALSCIYGKDIYVGFGRIENLESKCIDMVLQNRIAEGPFQDLDDFLDRVPVSLEQICLLIRVDAFRFTGKSKRILLWEAHFKLNKGPLPQNMLFRPAKKNFTLPELSSTAMEDAFDQMELIGFPLCSPFLLIKDLPDEALLARDLGLNLGAEVRMLGYLVTTKPTSTIKGERMHFGTFLDREGQYFDTVHFPPVSARYPFRGRGIYLVRGKVSEEFDVYSIEVSAMEKLALIEDPRYADEDSAKWKELISDSESKKPAKPIEKTKTK